MAEEKVEDVEDCLDLVTSNTLYGFAIGSTLGATRSFLSFIPSSNQALRALPTPYAQVANSIGKTGMNFAVISAIYTGGACAAKGIRGKNDSLNYGVGGASVGVFLGLRAKSLHQMVLNGIVMGAIGTGCAYSSRMVTHPIADATSQYNNMYSYMPGAKKVEE